MDLDRPDLQLLIISGAVRHMRDWYFESLSRVSENEASRYPLKDFPKQLGNWKAVEGKEETLEEGIAKIAKASDHVIRTYTDQNSGTDAVVMIIYGPATGVFSHTPAVCYPANGFGSESQPRDIQITRSDAASPARFREERFLKKKSGQRDYREVYHSFRNAGVWDVDMEAKWKSFRYHPGMYKVQVQLGKPTGDDEAENAAVHQLLESIVREIDQYAHKTI